MSSFDWIELAGNLLLFALVFGMSATVDIRALREQVRNRKAILTGIFLQFVILPVLGFLVVNAFDLDHSMGITLLVVTSSPGGSYSNWWCSMFNADLALSVTMTAISTLLSVVMLPLNLLIYAKYSYDDDVIHNLDWLSLFVALIIVISAISLGLFLSASRSSKKFNRFCNKLGNYAGIALVIFSATMTNTGGDDTKIWERDWVFYVGVAAPCVLGLIIANFITSFLQLKRPERVTVSIECCYQNVGIATSVALTMFEGDELNLAVGVPFYYGLVEAVVLGIYCVGAWKLGWTKAPSNESFCHVIATSYEIGNEDENDATASIELEGKTNADTEHYSSATQKDGTVVYDYVTMGEDKREATSSAPKAAEV